MASISAPAQQKVFVLGPRAYTKDCPISNRWDLKVSEDQSARIAAACKEGFINVRMIQGRITDIADGKSPWFGDNLGRVAEGLSKGQIQLQQDEVSSGIVLEREALHDIPRSEAKGWKDVSVVYVYGREPSAKLIAQAGENPSHMLLTANTIHALQFVALAGLKIVVGDELSDLLKYIKDPSTVRTL